MKKSSLIVASGVVTLFLVAVFYWLKPSQETAGVDLTALFAIKDDAQLSRKISDIPDAVLQQTSIKVLRDWENKYSKLKGNDLSMGDRYLVVKIWQALINPTLEKPALTLFFDAAKSEISQQPGSLGWKFLVDRFHNSNALIQICADHFLQEQPSSVVVQNCTAVLLKSSTSEAKALFEKLKDKPRFLETTLRYRLQHCQDIPKKDFNNWLASKQNIQPQVWLKIAFPDKAQLSEPMRDKIKRKALSYFSKPEVKISEEAKKSKNFKKRSMGRLFRKRLQSLKEKRFLAQWKAYSQKQPKQDQCLIQLIP